MATRLDKALDVLHAFSSSLATATRRRRRIRRRHIISAVNAVSALTSAVSVAVPQARPAAAALGALSRTAPHVVPPEKEGEPERVIPTPELDLLTRLQAVEAQIPHAAGQHLTRLEAQRDLLLKLIETYETNK